MSSSNDADWYKDAVIYELPVRAFRDSNADGIGDFAGLIEKLDYLADLGVTALWLLPFYPSPMRDGGYDIAEYLDVHPSHGTLDDFKRFLDAAHARGLRVITELVINHTSSDHPWFQKARLAAPGSRDRNFYVWSETPDKYAGARVIFKDFEVSNWTWDPIAKAYYWHRFYSHQPDLNFDNPDVCDALLEVLDFWLGLGVDGLRLDAVPYLFEREGTSSENLPETHAFLKRVRAHVDHKFPNRMLLAEANQWPIDAAAYFGDGDECHMNFHFPLMPRLFMALDGEDAFPIIDILTQTPAIPASCQWATFLRNHDELTLEMVTDEDRDYMYRVYALEDRARLNLGIRRRLFPLLRERRRVELLSALLFTLPGTPVMYYGDEIGMGDNIYLGDRDGVRTPMQWSSQRNAGFSDASPQRLFLPIIIEPEYHYEAINVEAQQLNPRSLLWWNKQLIALRKRHPVLGRGELSFVAADNPKVLAFVRADANEQLLVVANLSRFAQSADLDVSAYAGRVPLELLGHSAFSEMKREPYRITLGPHDFMLFALGSLKATASTPPPSGPLRLEGPWHAFSGRARIELADALLRYAKTCRWYRSKAAPVKATVIDDLVVFEADTAYILAFVGVEHPDTARETYLLPLRFEPDGAASDTSGKGPDEVTKGPPLIAEIVVDEPGAKEPRKGRLVDATGSKVFAQAWLDLMRQEARLPSERGTLCCRLFDGAKALIEGPLEPRFLPLDQSNSTIVYGSSLLLKLMRSIETGPSVELEMSQFLAASGMPRPPPRVVGTATMESRGDSRTVALLQEYIDNRGSAWTVTLSALSGFFERVLTSNEPLVPIALPTAESGTSPMVVPELLVHLASPYFTQAKLLARRTAELHLALAARRDMPAFAPEAIDLPHQHSLYQTAHTSLVRTFGQIRRALASLEGPRLALAKRLLALEPVVDKRLRAVISLRIDAARIRCHGDYHLGQVLFTGDDFVIIDFEGEPDRPLRSRRYKHSPFRDVAGMLRSFDYAAETALRSERVRPEDRAKLAPWGAAFRAWVTTAFTNEYVEVARGASFLPPSLEVTRSLLDFFELEKVIYELRYELNSRPDWLDVPLHGLLRLVDPHPESASDAHPATTLGSASDPESASDGTARGPALGA